MKSPLDPRQLSGPQLSDPDFSRRSWEGTQGVHAQFVDLDGPAIQLGFSFDGDSRRAAGHNLPTRGTAVSRGMVNKLVTGVEPNTEYRVELEIRGTGLMWGIFDAEHRLHYRGLAAGGPRAERYKGQQTPGNGTEWETVTATITTGPRTTELNAFCIMAENTGPGYCRRMDVTRVGPAAHPARAPETRSAPPPAPNGFPVTIPAVRRFEAAGGRWAPADGVAQVTVDPACRDALGDVAGLVAAQLAEAGLARAAVVRFGTAVPDGVHLTLGAVDTAGADRVQAHEAYSLRVAGDGVHVVAGGPAGALYAGATLVQALKGAGALPQGTVTDWTDQQWRGLQVDSGRRFYSLAWLRDHIRDLAYTKLNTLFLRVKDSEGLRIESDVLPGVVDNSPGGGHWSKAEVRELVEFARRHHVSVIPEFDVPGHSEMDTLVYPEFMFPGGEGEAAGWDYSRADVRRLLADVLRETGETFDSAFVHVGGDEFFGQDHPSALSWIRATTGDPSATSVDAYLQLFNELAAAIRADGRGTIMWNDMINGRNRAVSLDKEILIAYWAQIYESLSAEELIAEGHQLIGSSSDLYHDLWPPLNPDDKPNMTINQPLPEYQWETYLNPYVYSRGWSEPARLPAAAESGSHGQLFPIWDDAHGWAPEQLLTRTLLPRLRVHAQSAWNSPPPAATFAEFDEHLRFLGHAPFFGTARVPEQGSRVRPPAG